MATYCVEAADGKFYGPIDEAGLIGWAREGRLGPDLRVRNEPTGEMHFVAALPWLAAELRVAPPELSAPPAAAIPYATPAYLNSELLVNRLTPFPSPLVGVLHFFTLGLFTLFHLNLMHGKMPRLRRDDPTAAQAIGFMFIPIFGLYWAFFSFLRLVDRVDEQRVQRSMRPTGTKPAVVIILILFFIPFVNVVSHLIVAPAVWMVFQDKVNELAAAGHVPGSRSGSEPPAG